MNYDTIYNIINAYFLCRLKWYTYKEKKTFKRDTEIRGQSVISFEWLRKKFNRY